MDSTKVTIDEKAILNNATAEASVVLAIVGRMVRDKAVRSMKQHDHQLVRQPNGKTSLEWVGKTPKGQPPKIRTGLIANNIQAAQQGGMVFVGPIALAGHDTECLARLEFADHPFMQPAFNNVMQQLPEVWARSISQ